VRFRLLARSHFKDSDPYRFPVEIWQQILLLACIHGGSTGCALSLVSHHIREVSAAFRFRTAAVTGLRWLRSLLNALQHASEAERRVRALFIRTRSYGWREAIEAERFWGRRVTSEDIVTQETRLAGRWLEGADEWSAAYQALITLVAPSVEVFSIYVPYLAEDAIIP
jgi:hypothetical protein